MQITTFNIGIKMRTTIIPHTKSAYFIINTVSGFWALTDQCGGCCFWDLIMPGNEDVLPMVAPGACLSDMVLGGDKE